MSRDRDEHEPPATEAVLVSEVVPATRERVFAAWLSSEQHSAFTGEPAVISAEVGARHSTFGGDAAGTIVAVDPFRRIVKTWRSPHFPAASADSTVEITLEETVGGTLVTILHSDIPTGLSDRCREQWTQRCLDPLKRYFVGRVSNGVHPIDQQALAKRRRRASAGTAKARGKRPRAGKRAATTGKTAVRARPRGKAAAGKATATRARKPGKRTVVAKPGKAAPARKRAKAGSGGHSKKRATKRAKSRPGKRR